MRDWRRSGDTLIEAAIFLALCGVLLVLFLPLLQGNNNGKSASCQSNLKQIGFAMAQYTQDHTNKFPPTALNEKVKGELPFMKPYGWADALKPYLAEMSDEMSLFHCPANQAVRGNDVTQKGINDYWFNSNLNALPTRDVEEPYETLLCGDGNDGHDQTDARYHLNALPQNWLTNSESPAHRHSGTANYLFADGHVSTFTPDAVSKLDWFAIKVTKS